ncbi:MAG: AbrB family transcriptional regulator [Synechococcus sp. SB0665_bin_28]|nr:AbrB family transcriptional regulator [Synechococcus sp. SB0665_bin_28]MYF20305.1 AbrB family transcriptional regulator [Synechococcus sp. SB0677_bin_5]MYF36826.1 AbrB family transcriptional regulator [Synechococcus sp. SB0678_bin_12]MYG64796.1 AbrB family transcriptional regulator [Synechococcus sp. SB0675_bin_7]MYI88028.1 AbrB family transcriptional regulator [Synechococcus sp. SB0672_bin_10]MYK85581.1 AbrB family transcriptional regulator [Synechococcus sp. SB0669_bin_7]
MASLSSHSDTLTANPRPRDTHSSTTTWQQNTGRCGHWMDSVKLLPGLVTVLAGSGLGLLALGTRIPAAPLVGALLGAALVSLIPDLPAIHWPTGTRTTLEIAVGIVIGSGLTATTLQEMRHLWRPALFITLALLAAGIVVGACSSRLLGIKLTVGLLGAAPGGLTGMSLAGEELGAGATVAALHTVRLVTVLVVMPLLVRLLTMGQGGSPDGP